MPAARPDHDRETGVLDPVTSPPSLQMEAAIARLRLQGAVFLRAEYRDPWAYESLTGATAAYLRPGTDRVILFHVVSSGTCWVQVGDGPKHWAATGDVIVLPYGDQHQIGGETETDTVPIETSLQPPPWTTMAVLRHGTGGPRTDVVCRVPAHHRSALQPRAARVPAGVRGPTGAAAEWVSANIAFALQQTSASPATPPAGATRLPELLLVEVLSLHLAGAPASEHGWAAALTDPILAPALAAIHGAPKRRWTVTELAAAAAVSRSLLDSQFRKVLGRSPIRYLTEWRMHLAQDLLATTDLGVVAAAHRVGYYAEEAFSRAFKRVVGSPPGAWRAAFGQRGE
ncbi:MAG: AraC family transcriptional regulator [Jatrophihabitans sp.]|uniref:AraC family transcriptional regulator n=1 Tax=Jatrophihabitans sp. TaxID=1932789 RepID=UPI00390D0361